MPAQLREDLLAAGLEGFERDGFDGATVAAIRARARASNGSFFHFFASKKELAATLFLETLQRYHAAILAEVMPGLSAREGIGRLIRAHLDWVVERRRAPLVASGELLPLPQAVFASQIIGPAQIFCRAFLSGRDRSDPRPQADQLVACAIRALVSDKSIGDET